MRPLPASPSPVDTPAARLADALDQGAGSPDETIQNALDFVRTHLGMEVAYLSEFIGDDLVFRAVSAPGFEDMCFVGAQMPLDQVYCRHILAGRLPELIPDTAQEPLCAEIPITANIPIKSHVSVPIRRSDGRPYGMFCCLSREARADLTSRDLDVMRAFATLSADQINDRIAKRLETAAIRNAITGVIKADALDVAYQPIFDSCTLAPQGFEALSRFHTDPYRPPNLWFDDAARVGLQPTLEEAAIERALRAIPTLPEHTYISVNASPDTVAAGGLEHIFAPYPGARILLEITEHAQATDDMALLAALVPLRAMGVRLAIDDAGAGYSGLQQIVQMQPDVIKLDVSLTRGIDTDLVRRSLAAALVGFASEIDAKIVAEGIETKQEFSTIKELGVPLVQGYLLGKPMPLAEACQVCTPAKSA